MTREELRGHCLRQIQQFEKIKEIMPVTPNHYKQYEEHKLVLELLEQESVLDKIRADIEEYKSRQLTLALGAADLELGKQIALKYVLGILDKYEVEKEVG